MIKPSSKAVWGAVVALAILWPLTAAAGPRPSSNLDRALQAVSGSDRKLDVIVRAKAGHESAVDKPVDMRVTRSASDLCRDVVSGLVAVMFEANRAGAEQRWQDYQNSIKRNQRDPFVAPAALTANAVKALLEYEHGGRRDARLDL